MSNATISHNGHLSTPGSPCFCETFYLGSRNPKVGGAVSTSLPSLIVIVGFLTFSTLALLARLQYAYQFSYDQQRRAIRKLARDNWRKKKKSHKILEDVYTVLPAYYSVVLMGSFIFVIQAILILAHSSPTCSEFLYNLARYWMWGFSLFLDNLVLIYLLGPHFLRGETRQWQFCTSAGASLAVSMTVGIFVAYTYFTKDLGMDHCDWCGLKFPVRGIEYFYGFFALLYIITAVSTASDDPQSQGLNRVNLQDPVEAPLAFSAAPTDLQLMISPRPAARIWGLFLAVQYLCYSVGLLLLESGIGFGYCMLSAGEE
jgi:hypothetical protein